MSFLALTQWHWLGVWLAGLACYPLLNRQKPRYYWQTIWDTHIPLIPVWLLPYACHMPFALVGIWLLWSQPTGLPYLQTLSLATWSGNVFWLLFPNGVKRPEPKLGLPWATLFRWLYATDHDANGLPSAHVFISLITSWYFATTYPQLNWMWWGIGGSISLSTLFTKQHYLGDVVAGILWAVTAILLTNFFILK